MKEEDVFICGWSQSDEGFEIWVKAHPHVRARGPTAFEAQERLVEAIMEHELAFFAPLEFVPPLPLTEFEKKYASPEIYTLCGDQHADADLPKRSSFELEEERGLREAQSDSYFDGGICRACDTARGRRSSRQLTLTALNASWGGAFRYFCGATMQLFSERFIGLLSAEERQGLEFQPTNRSKRARIAFFELVGPSGPPLVAPQGIELGGWQCPTCGAQCFGTKDNQLISHFVARSDLPDPLPEVFTIGTQPNLHLCVTKRRWAELVDRPESRGVLSTMVGVVADNEVVRRPELPTRSDIERDWRRERALKVAPEDPPT